jgi:predicted RNA-binding Zn-ribbon protein involved in translation (DUF1610 family)
MNEWIREDTLVEVALIVDYDYGPIVNPEESAVVICVCPKCGKKNIYHYPLRLLLNYDFIDSGRIEAEIKDRGLVDGRKEVDKEASIARMSQRVAETQVALGLGMDKAPPDKPIPDFELPCHNSNCDEVWTKDNTNPRWMTPDHLVVRCPKCGSQRPINKELEEDEEDENS